jgi:hypothetical protein
LEFFIIAAQRARTLAMETTVQRNPARADT